VRRSTGANNDNQRADACNDPVLRKILALKCDERNQHAAMLLDWIRRRAPACDQKPADHVLTHKPLTHD
jgi:hypothetical protein